MDMNERFLTLLTPEGEFVQINKKEQFYELGQEISIPIQEKQSSPFITFLQSFKGKSLVAATMACMLALVTFIPFTDNDVYAYMSIDVNPSIELGVNEDLQVIEMIPYNEEGKQIVDELKGWKNEDITIVTEKVLTSIKENGYLEKEHQIVIGTVHTVERDKETEVKLQEALEGLEKDIAKEEAEVISVEATEEERDLAIESGVTTGKYIVEQKKEKAQKKLPANSNEKAKENQLKKKEEKALKNEQKLEKNPEQTVPPKGNEGNKGVGQDKKAEKAQQNENSNKNKEKQKDNSAKRDYKGPQEKNKWNHQDGNKEKKQKKNHNAENNKGMHVKENNKKKENSTKPDKNNKDH